MAEAAGRFNTALSSLPADLVSGSFDVVLCLNLTQYVDDVGKTLTVTGRQWRVD